MLRRGGKLLTGFIADNLVKRSTDAVNYSMQDLIGIDSIEKGGIKLYNTTVYALVFQGQPYASTEYGFYPLEKRGSDFISPVRQKPLPIEQT